MEMGIISPRGENLLDFLELRQVPSTYDGALRDPLWRGRAGETGISKWRKKKKGNIFYYFLDLITTINFPN